MASKYLQKYPVPEDFPDLLHDFTREVLRDQPEDIYDYGAQYFAAMYKVSRIIQTHKANVLTFFCRALHSNIIAKVKTFHHPRIDNQILQTIKKWHQLKLLSRSRMLQLESTSNMVFHKLIMRQVRKLKNRGRVRSTLMLKNMSKIS